MNLFNSYDGKNCKNCKYLITRKKFFSKQKIYKCGIQISGNLLNINSFYCCLYEKKDKDLYENKNI